MAAVSSPYHDQGSHGAVMKWSNDSLHLTKELNSRKEVIYDRQKSEEKIYGRV